MFRHERREERREEERREELVVGAVVVGHHRAEREEREERRLEAEMQDMYYPPAEYYPPPAEVYPPPAEVYAPSGVYYPPSAQPAPAYAAPLENVNVTVVMPSASKAAAPITSLAKDALTWDTERVIKHLHSIGMPASDIARCAEAEVTGEDFVTGEEDDLHEDLKISKLHVRKIKRSLGVE